MKTDTTEITLELLLDAAVASTQDQTIANLEKLSRQLREYALKASDDALVMQCACNPRAYLLDQAG